jgi:hypothetical protein
MMRCSGPIGVPRTFSRKLPPDVIKLHPVETVGPSVTLPFLPTFTSVPELEVRVPEVWPVVRPKLKSLMSWAASVGFASRSDNMIMTVFAPVVNVAEASTGCPPLVAPDAVVKVMEAALALHFSRLAQIDSANKDLLFIV